MTAAGSVAPSAALAPVAAEVARALRAFERELDPARPTARAGVEIVGYGEVSTVFTVTALPSLVCKRMAGFRDAGAVERYVAVVERYLDLLTATGVRVVPTAVAPLERDTGGPVVYLVQPRLDPRHLGNHLLRDATDAILLGCMDRLLTAFRTVLLANRTRPDGRTATVDGQLSNWHFPLADDDVGEPRLLDVGTPYMRLHGTDELDLELFLAPAPAPLRWIYRRTRAVKRYIDDYFDPRMLLLDLIGNFHKEGRPDRIPLVVTHVNRWLAVAGTDLGVHPLTPAEADRYYRQDARTLELYLKLRRLDRFVRTRVLRGRYDFILPLPVQR
jgi:hypothetical protein